MMKSHARVVIIGGGAVGCSALYHLTKLGISDAVLIERDELTAGSTWHAAGNCPNFSTSWNLIKLQRHSTQLYARLAREVDYDINYHVTGSIRLAHAQDRVDEFRHVISQANAQGIGAGRWSGGLARIGQVGDRNRRAQRAHEAIRQWGTARRLFDYQRIEIKLHHRRQS